MCVASTAYVLRSTLHPEAELLSYGITIQLGLAMPEYVVKMQSLCHGRLAGEKMLAIQRDLPSSSRRHLLHLLDLPLCFRKICPRNISLGFASQNRLSKALPFSPFDIICFTFSTLVAIRYTPRAKLLPESGQINDIVFVGGAKGYQSRSRCVTFSPSLRHQ